MKGKWITRLALRLGLRRQVKPPAWFDAAYLSAPESAPLRPAVPLQPGRAFSERERAAIWAKARPMRGWDPDDWRADHRGQPIFRHHYADSDSAYGWEVGLIFAHGGESIANLRPHLCRERAPEPAEGEAVYDLDRSGQ